MPPLIWPILPFQPFSRRRIYKYNASRPRTVILALHFKMVIGLRSIATWKCISLLHQLSSIKGRRGPIRNGFSFHNCACMGNGQLDSCVCYVDRQQDGIEYHGEEDNLLFPFSFFIRQCDSDVVGYFRVLLLIETIICWI